MQIANIAKKLESVGLTEKQAKVYVAALFLGPAAVQRIAEQAEVNRATTYVILAELADMGLVSETTEGKKTVFVAEPPEAIDRYLGAIEKEIEGRKSHLKEAMKELKGVSRIEVEDAPVVRFFKGPEAAKAVSAYLKRKAKRNETVYSVSDVDEVMKIFPEILTKTPLQRKKKNIASKIFYSGSIEVKNDPVSNRTTKKLTEKARGDVNIYGDRMTILSYRGDDSIGVIIESKEIVAVMRQLFELAWQKQDRR
jgi:sugar-specific transcriptional regulator TrmB